MSRCEPRALSRVGPPCVLTQPVQVELAAAKAEREAQQRVLFAERRAREEAAAELRREAERKVSTQSDPAHANLLRLAKGPPRDRRRQRLLHAQQKRLHALLRQRKSAGFRRRRSVVSGRKTADAAVSKL